METPKIAVVAPVHVQPTVEWVASLRSVCQRSNVKVIIVDDSDGAVSLPAEWEVYDYMSQCETLGEELYQRFEQFHKSSACRNFGHWVAYKQGFDIIIALDSDCNVPPDFIARHLEALAREGSDWTNPIKHTTWFPRGYPYSARNRPILANVGLWEHELDINGLDRVERGTPPNHPGNSDRHEVAHGILPFCGMNVAFDAKLTPALLFLPNWDFAEWKFRRHDDIWGGYILQKLMQIKKDKVSYGYPLVWHDTVIDAADDAKNEEAMINFEDQFYGFVDYAVSHLYAQDCSGKDYAELLKDLVHIIEVRGLFPDSALMPVIQSLQLWVDMFRAG